MSNEVVKSVWAVSDKEYRGKTLHNFMTEDNEWVGTGEKDYQLKVGDAVKYTLGHTAGGNAKVVGQLKVKRGGGTKPPASSNNSQQGNSGGGSNKGSGKRGGGGYKQEPNTQIMIARQNANQPSADIVIAAINAGALKLPTKKADQLDAILDYQREVANTITKNTLVLYRELTTGAVNLEKLIAGESQETHDFEGETNKVRQQASEDGDDGWDDDNEFATSDSGQGDDGWSNA